MRVVIVGGGIIGLCTAYYASKRGHEVTIVERGGADDRGCSFGNAGMIVPSHFVPLAAPGIVAMALRWMWNDKSPFYVKPRIDRDLLQWGWRFLRAATPANVARAAPLLGELQLASRRLFEELAREIDFGLVTRGIIMLCKSEHALHDEARLAREAVPLGMPAEVVDRAQLAELEPNMRLDVAGGVLYPKDAHIDPVRLMFGLRRVLEESGVDFAWHREVTGWRVRDSSIEAVTTSAGDLQADEYVVCGGAWSPDVVRALEVRLPMQPGKGYSLTLPSPPLMPTRGMILMEARVAVTPMGDALRFGGTMEIAGLDETIRPSRIQGIVESVPKYLPDFEPKHFDGVQPWCGLRPLSPDGLPYVGRVARYANLSVATGHAMLGLSLGPITGKLMSEILSGEPTSIRTDLVLPDRFEGSVQS